LTERQHLFLALAANDATNCELAASLGRHSRPFQAVGLTAGRIRQTTSTGLWK